MGDPPRPSLILLNLLLGNTYRIQNGQVFAIALLERGFIFSPIEEKHLVTRKPFDNNGQTFFA